MLKTFEEIQAKEEIITYKTGESKEGIFANFVEDEEIDLDIDCYEELYLDYLTETLKQLK